MDIIERLKALSSCEVSDGLHACGLPQDGLPGIRPLDPKSKVIGRAFTVSFSTSKDAKRIDYMVDVKPGDVIVLANEGRTNCSVWGGLRSVAAMERGAVGTVIHGVYRDLLEHPELGYDVFGLGPTIVGGSSGRVVPSDFGKRVMIGDVLVSPGDFLIGDASGVAIIPKDRAEEVVAASEAILERDRKKAEGLRAGGTLG